MRTIGTEAATQGSLETLELDLGVDLTLMRCLEDPSEMTSFSMAWVVPVAPGRRQIVRNARHVGTTKKFSYL